MEARAGQTPKRNLSQGTWKWKPGIFYHPTPPCGDGDAGAFTHMDGWAENVDLAACFLSPVICPREANTPAINVVYCCRQGIHCLSSPGNEADWKTKVQDSNESQIDICLPEPLLIVNWSRLFQRHALLAAMLLLAAALLYKSIHIHFKV